MLQVIAHLEYEVDKAHYAIVEARKSEAYTSEKQRAKRIATLEAWMTECGAALAILRKA